MGRAVALMLTFGMVALSLLVDGGAAAPSRGQARGAAAARADAREAVLRGQLAVRHGAFVHPDGTPFRWRGITAFRLLEQVARGRERDARAYLEWARAKGFNLVRVLGMATHLFQLTPQDGLKALPRLLRLAADAGVYVELVVFADTLDYPRLNYAQHVDAVAAALRGATHVVVELGNENAHPTQDRRLTDAGLLRGLRARLPAGLPVSLGSMHGGDVTERYPGGDYLTAHLDRGGHAWQQVGRIAGLANLAAQTGRPVVNDEPIGAGERVDPGRRLVDPAAFFAMALMGRMSGVGSTFHCEDCLHARLPGPTQAACAAAFIEGSRVLPDAAEASLAPRAGRGGPLSADPVPGAAGVHVASISGGQWHLVLALGLKPGAAIPWRPRWSATVIEERAGVRVYRAKQ